MNLDKFYDSVNDSYYYCERKFMKVVRFPYKLKAFIKNCWYYKSILWHDRDFDHYYFLTVMETKLNKMARHFASDNCHSINGLKDSKNIKLCVELIKRLKENSYSEFYCRDRPEEFMTFSEPDDRGYTECFFKEYIKTSHFGPIEESFIWDREKYMRKQDYDYLFHMLRKHLDTWWD